MLIWHEGDIFYSNIIFSIILYFFQFIGWINFLLGNLEVGWLVNVTWIIELWSHFTILYWISNKVQKLESIQLLFFPLEFLFNLLPSRCSHYKNNFDICTLSIFIIFIYFLPSSLSLLAMVSPCSKPISFFFRPKIVYTDMVQPTAKSLGLDKVKQSLTRSSINYWLTISIHTGLSLIDIQNYFVHPCQNFLPTIPTATCIRISPLFESKDTIW